MPRSRVLLLVAAVLIGVVHVALVQHFEPFEWLTSAEPITGVDFDTHAEQTWRVLEGLEGWGKSWVYDVHLQAGYPNGTIFDADNKLWELWTYALHQLGIPKASGFNSFVLLAHLLILPWTFLAARTFGLGAGRSLVASALASLLWFFDSYAHWFWWIGTLAYIFAAYYFVLPLALFYRFTLDRKLWRVGLVAVLLALGHLLHPYTFFILALPMLILYWRARSTLSLTDHAAIVGMALVVVLANAYWLIVAIRHWHYILNSAFFGQSHAGFVFADLFNVLLDSSTTGYLGTRAGFRWLCLVAGIGNLYFWRRERDPRYALFAGSFVTMFALAYVVPIWSASIRQIQPYRFVASAMFLAVFPAAELLHRVWSERRVLFATPLARIALALCLVPGVQHLAGDVLYFMPDWLPNVPAIRDAPFPLAATGFAPHFDYRHVKPGVLDHSVDRWINEHAAEGRIAVPDWTGERYAWSTRAQILGGFVDLNMQHARAHPLRWSDRAWPNATQLAQYIATYAVRYFIVRFDDFGLNAAPEQVSLHATFAGVRIYQARMPVNFFAEGSGRLAVQTNRILISQSDPNTALVLKYHWHEALICKPNCKAQRAASEVDEVGFIRVPAPHPPELTIENSYR